MNDSTFNTQKQLPLIMLHGVLGTPSNWNELLPLIPQAFLPVVMDIPFFDQKLGLTNIPTVIDYAEKFIEDKKFKKVVLVGNSFGGHISCLLAVKRPELVSGLVLSGSGGLFERGFTRVPGARPDREWVRQKAAEVFYDSRHVNEELLDMLMDFTVNRDKGKMLLQLAKAAKRDNILERLRKISCPALLIWGKQDNVTDSKVAEEFHANIANSKLVWLDKCGHAAMMEQPQEFARELNIWWQDNF